MYVIKADGSRELFKREKIIRTCRRAGVDRKTAEEIANNITKATPNYSSTHTIYRMILDELEKRKDKSSFFYRIREAIANLDPISFELYVKEVLEAHGYKCKWNLRIRGKCVEHQIDIIALRNNESYLVECKRHFNPHRFSGLEIPLEIQARLEDIRDGYKEKKNKYNFTGAWIITNTKFSEHAKRYSLKKGIRLTGWRYKDMFSLENMATSLRILPITILKIDVALQKSLLEKKVITISDLLAISRERLRAITGMKKHEVDKVTDQAKSLML